MLIRLNNYYKELPSLEALKGFFQSLPGVGPKIAQRYTLYFIQQSKEYKMHVIQTIQNSINNVHICPKCGMITEKPLCFVCSQEHKRDKKICIVEKYEDVFIIEQSGYFGLYHVLNGLINPLENITPEKLNIKALISRIKNNKIEEIIFALSPTTEGEATILYLMEQLKKYNVKMTRISAGIPYGGSIEHIDALTLKKSIEGRQVVK